MKPLQPNPFNIKYLFFKAFPKTLSKPSFLTFSLVTLMFYVQQERCFKGILRKELMRSSRTWNTDIIYHVEKPFPIITSFHKYFCIHICSFCFAINVQFPLKPKAKAAECGSGHIAPYLDLAPNSHFLLGKLQLITLLGGWEEMCVLVCIENTIQTAISWRFKWL